MLFCNWILDVFSFLLGNLELSIKLLDKVFALILNVDFALVATLIKNVEFDSLSEGILWVERFV